MRCNAEVGLFTKPSRFDQGKDIDKNANEPGIMQTQIHTKINLSFDTQAAFFYNYLS